MKMFMNDEFAMYVYQKHIESILNRFKKEKRFPCLSVGKLTSNCNRRNFYGIKDMYDGIEPQFDRDSIIRMTMGQVLHESFILSDKAEWHLVYNKIYGHIDEYFSEAKILVEKKTTITEIPGWKQTLTKSKDRFKYMPNEEWENQLRYYYLLIQKGKVVGTNKPANPDQINMVKRVYVIFYRPDLDHMLQPYVVPVLMRGQKWTIPYIEEELFDKVEEIETCLKEKTIPMRVPSPYRCQYCPYMVRCYVQDKVEGDDEIPEDMRISLGKRSLEAEIQELKA